MSATPNAPKPMKYPPDKEPVAEETFGSKLKQMRKDLISIANRMNIDKSEDIADMAQKALKHITELEREIKSTFEDLSWDWQPHDPDDEDDE